MAIDEVFLISANKNMAIAKEEEDILFLSSAIYLKNNC